MGNWHKSVLVLGGVTVIAGCATREPPPDQLPPSAAGTDYITDNSDAAYYVEGNWTSSTASSGYLGDDYDVIARGSGNNHAVFNIETIQEYEVSARWTAHSNRASNAKFVIHHIDDSGQLVTDTVTVNQRENGGKWVQLGIYRMSNLTGRVTLSDDANGYVIADAVRFRPLSMDSTDSDSDGMPDWYEISYGLDPNDASDADMDLDGDGLSNVDEFVVGSDPSVVGEDIVSPEPGTSVTLSWTPPTTRENGAPLESGDIAYYEVEYAPVADDEPIQVDDTSQYFQLYGGNVNTSSHTEGYVGSGYHPLPPGSGEILAEWSVYELVPGTSYSLEANWTSEGNRSSSAPFTVSFVGQSGTVMEETFTVDQTQGGGTWHRLTELTPGNASIVVEASNTPDGYVVADAIRLVPLANGAAQTLTVEDPRKTNVAVTGLNQGMWQFRVRTVDQSGVKSRFTDAVTYEVR